MMRGTAKMRLTLGILSPLFLLLWVVAIYSEETRPWMGYQETFHQMYVDRAREKLKEASSQDDEKQMARWQQVIDEFSAAEPEILQVYLEDIKVADRCSTCHRGIDNALFQDAPEPFRTHPGETLKHHDHNMFGCTPCHQGQGPATTVKAAHGEEENWLEPLLPAEYLQLSCAKCHEVSHGVTGAEIISKGADLFMETGCYGCHDVKDYSYRPRFSPPLNRASRKLVDDKTFIYNWVKDPKKVSPDTAMPDFLLDEEELGKIVSFLLTLPEGEPLEPVSLGETSEEDGKRLFEERGCIGCHGVEPDKHSVSARVPHLAGLGSKVTREWLDAWIKDPKKWNPDTAMPTIRLVDPNAFDIDQLTSTAENADPNAPPPEKKPATELENDARHDLLAYLLSLTREEELPPAPDLSSFDPEEGKKLVKKYECYGCHEIEGFKDTRPAVPDLAEFARRPVHELDFGTVPETEVPHTKWDWLRHKMRKPRAYEREDIQLFMPAYELTDQEIHALVAYSMSWEKPDWPERYIVRTSDAKQALRDVSWMVSRFNCRGCHQMDREEKAHIVQFLERKTFAGPNMNDVGARLQGQYLYDFLLEPKRVRPWLQMEMPTFDFSEETARILVTGFAANQDVVNPYTYVATKPARDEHFERGVRRFLHFKCVQCHPTSLDQGLPADVDPEDLSINLMLTKERCRPDWLKDFMARPKDIAGMDTRMPTVFYTVDGIPKVEKPEEDINDITVYMMAMLEPPEVTLAAQEAAIEAEEAEDEIDWTEYQE